MGGRWANGDVSDQIDVLEAFRCCEKLGPLCRDELADWALEDQLALLDHDEVFGDLLDLGEQVA